MVRNTAASNARNARNTPNKPAPKAQKEEVMSDTATAPNVDQDLLAAFKAQLAAMSPEDRKAVLKQVKIPRSKPAVVVPDNYTSADAESDYVKAVAAARKAERKARELRALADAALEVWIAVNPSVKIHRGKVIEVDGAEYVDG